MESTEKIEMENNNLINKFFAKHKVGIISITIFLTLFNFSLSILNIIESLDYPMSKPVILRNIAYILTTAVIIILFKFNEFILNLSIEKIKILTLYNIILYVPIILAYMTVISVKFSFDVILYTSIVKSYNDLISIISRLNIAILFCMLLLIISKSKIYKNIIMIFNAKIILYILLLIAIVSIATPLMVDKNINYESSVNYEILKKYFPERKEADLIQINIEDPEIIEIIKNRDSILKGIGFYKTPKAYIINFENNHIEVIFYPGIDLSAICLFLDYDSLKNYNELIECNNILGLKNDVNIFTKVDIIRKKSTIKREFKEILINKIDLIISARKGIEEINSEQILETMSVRGYIAHHYNSILIGLRNNNITNYFWNQYGLGSLLLIKIISLITDLNYFDSIFISIILINSLSFTGILYFYKNNKLIIYSFIISILIIFFISNIFAPFLYYIRSLPYLFYLIFLQKTSNLKELYSIKNKILNITGIVFCALYNKEYALILFFALLISGIVSDCKYYIKNALFLLLIFTISIVYYFTLDIQGSNFLALMLGIGFDSSFKPQLFLYIIILMGLILTAYKNVKVSNKNIILLLLLSILGFSFKYLINQGINHIGWIFILIAIFYSAVPEVDKKVVVLMYVIPSLILLSVSAYGLKYNYFLKEYKYINYAIYPEFSKFFKIDERIWRKYKSIENYKSKNTCIVSKQDEFMSILSEKNITSNLPNLSTNINHYIDVNIALKNYTKCEIIIIDKEIYDFNTERFLIINAYNTSNIRLNNYINSYLIDVNKIRFFANKIIENRNLVDENLFFYIYK